MTTTAYFATSNPGKIIRAQRSLHPHGVTVEAVPKLDLVEIQAPTVAAVAAQKARDAFAIVRHPIFVADTGITIDALNGFPGPYLKDINEWIGLKGYLALLVEFPGPEHRRCVVHETLAFMAPGLAEPLCFDIEVEGSMADHIRGVRRIDQMRLAGLFIPKGHDQTYAEMDEAAYLAFRLAHASTAAAYARLAAAVRAYPRAE